MPDLIIGHTSETSARVWVRGDRTSTACTISVRPAGKSNPQDAALEAESDYTAAVDLLDLVPGTDYGVEAVFSPSGIRVRGRLCTIRAADKHDPGSFSFVLSSCNLSNVSINDFLSFLTASVGIALARSSLSLPFHRWKLLPFKWMTTVARVVLDGAIKLIAAVVTLFTGIKQPGPPYIRSPFLKLSAVFESLLVDIELPAVVQPQDDGGAAIEPPFIAVGDRVHSSWGGTGVVASTSRIVSANKTRLSRRLVLTQVDGPFDKGSILFRTSAEPDKGSHRLGAIVDAVPGRPWFEPPSFFVHAGDQIYFDFPSPSRKPDREEYRSAYRDAWFEDEPLRHLLAHWPHYMTLDDHEIADQFAQDFTPPNEEFLAEKYRQEASIAYREYALALSPLREKDKPLSKCGSYWYTFDKKQASFFVLDTRTCRHNKRGEIIDPEQMRQLLQWLDKHPRRLKFVVTSVPFVAEVDPSAARWKADWYKEAPAAQVMKAVGVRGAEGAGSEATRGAVASAGVSEACGKTAAFNPAEDQWSAPPFKCQRDEIIEHIAANGIEQVVFLTGDMHCCYHATMRIGRGPTKYESITVHELAGGPVNQLQLAEHDELKRRSTGRTAGKDESRRVDYEVMLERFHGEVSAVMHLKVQYKPRPQVVTEGDDLVPEVEWNVIRTLTDPEASGWLKGDAGISTSSLELDASGPPIGESVMAGRISFIAQRLPKDLQQWPTHTHPTHATQS